MLTDTYDRGDVVWGIAPVWASKRAKEALDEGEQEITESEIKARPWVIISDDRHPFFPYQYIAVAVTSKDRLISHPLLNKYWVAGGTPRESFVSPWCTYCLQHQHIVSPPEYEVIDDPYIGRLHDWFVNEIARETTYYINTTPL